MTSSAQAACEDALLAILQADATLAALAGPPQLFEPQDPKDEHVWISEDSTETQEASLTGNIPERREDFTIGVVVFVVKTGDDYKRTRDRGVVLVAAIEGLVKANPQLAGAAWYAEVVGIVRTSAAWDKRRGVVHVVSVRCRQYLLGP
jgi:hypothetical protein